jgi:heme/copper-type cytochrome/quinol oxidase subunit 3
MSVTCTSRAFQAHSRIKMDKMRCISQKNKLTCVLEFPILCCKLFLAEYHGEAQGNIPMGAFPSAYLTAVGFHCLFLFGDVAAGTG